MYGKKNLGKNARVIGFPNKRAVARRSSKDTDVFYASAMQG